ncbi:MAG: PAS domain S-box protein, partial [Gemmatimonas sp.]
METLLRVLIVEDNEDDAMLLLRLLRRAGYDPVFALVQTAADLTAALGREDWDLVVSDYALPQFDAPTALRLLKQFGRDVPFIVVSGTVSEVTAVEMMKAGAHDYVLKHNLIRFVPAVQRELREAAGRRELAKSEQSRQGLEIERDRLLEQLKQENEDLAALTLVSSSAISTLDLGDLLRDLLTRIADLMHADTASISLADGAELRVYASAGVVGVTSRDDARVIRIGEGFIGAVALQAQPVYVEDAALDPRIQEPRFLEPGIRSALGVPLTRNGTLIGVLSVGWRSARARRDREVHLLEITAERCAAAIQNSQKYEESRRLTIALTESEARFRTIVESDLIGLMYWNANGEITGANDALLRIIGYTQDDVRAGRVQWRNMTPPEYRAQDEAVLEELATKGSSAPFEKEYIHRDGSRVWILMGAALYTSSPGHGVAFVIDISQRKRAEQAQRWSEQRYRAIFAAEPECVKVLDADGHLLEMNAAGLAMLEADSLSDVRSSGLASFVLPEYREAFRVLHARALTGYSGLLEFEIVGRHGTRRWLETHAAPLLDATGNVSMMLGITRDVTGRKLATEELRRSEQDLAITLQSIGDGVIATDTAGLVTRMNATAERLTGWSLAEAVGKSLPEVFNIIHAKTREPVRDPAQAVLSREEVVHLASQTALIARDGSEYRIADSAAPIRDAAGDIAGVVLVFNDVSEKVLAQQTLAETVSLLERTGEMAKIGGWELDVRTMSLHWSKEAFRIHDVDDLSIHDFEGGMKFYPPEAQPIMRAAVQAAIDHGTPYDLELPKITATGRHIFVRTQATVVMEDGKAIKLLGAVHDITARKQADAELRLQGAAMNAAADAIVITNRDGTIEWVNPAFTALTGYSAKEAVGRRHKELVSSGVHDRAFFQDLWNTILADRVWHGEMTNRRKDLSRYIVDQAITPVKDEFGEFSNFIAIERDLTEHRRLEGQFLQAQKMEVVGRLASGIAHDFNNLLTVINGTADLALTQLDQDDPLREDFAQIHSAGDRAASLTRQLLAFSRQQVMQPVILNLSALVVNLHDLLQRLIGEDIALVVTENTQPG